MEKRLTITEQLVEIYTGKTLEEIEANNKLLKEII